MEEKTMHFANFNITFGKNEEPMLTHFEDVIFPAFTSKYIRGKEDEFPKFSFNEVEVKEYIEGEYALVGNYIKDTNYDVYTTVTDGELKPSPNKVPTAPYSRFIIFLKNHRMILVKNEPNSPDIRSFQATVRYIMNKYIRESNKKKENKSEYLPICTVNIVDIPLKEDIESILKDIDKINWVKLRFFPLNNDLNPLPIAQAIKDEMGRIGSRTANTQFNSPDSKAGVQKMLEETSGLAATTMLVTDKEGEHKKIKEDSFSSNKKISFSKNIEKSDDDFFISIAQKDEVINKTSPENQKLFDKFKGVIMKLMM